MRGAVAGAVLGGVIAFATGDVSVLAGAAIGGVVGGLAGAAHKYFSYRMAYAQSDAGACQNEMELDKDGDEDRLFRFNIADIIPLVGTTLDMIAQEVGVSEEQKLDEVQPYSGAPFALKDEARDVMRAITAIGRGNLFSADAIGTSQTALGTVSKLTARPVPPVRPDLADKRRYVRNETARMVHVGANVLKRLAMD